MTNEEKDYLLAYQRHDVVDADKDSSFPVMVDPALCHHARPLDLSQFNCPDCKTGHLSKHRPDWSLIGAIKFCRECGYSLGTHGGTIE